MQENAQKLRNLRQTRAHQIRRKLPCKKRIAGTDELMVNSVPNIYCPTTSTINSLQPFAGASGPKLVIMGSCFGTTVPYLVDTGAQVNAISQHDLPRELIEKLGPVMIKICSYEGNQLQILGTIRLDITFGEYELNDALFYVTAAPTTAVIGTGVLLRKNKFAIDTEKKLILIDGKEIPVEMIYATGTGPDVNYITPIIAATENNRKTKFVVMDDRTIPARTEVLITVIPQDLFSDMGYFITEPESCETNGLMVASSVHEIWNNEKSVIRVMNLNDYDITIYENSVAVQINEIKPQDLLHGTPDKGANDDERFDRLLSEVQIGNVPTEIKTRVVKFIRDNQDILAMEGERLGRTNAIEYDISTGDSPPVAAQKYRTPYFLRDEMKRIIDHNIDIGLMEPCSSPWAAPCLLVQKPSGKYRLVCDYRKLNLKTVSDNYPLPLIEDLLNELHGSTVFSSCDLFSGFHQIPVSEKTKEKVAICTDSGQYTWKVMPMGGKNGPACFQRMMDKIFRGVPASRQIIYLDDLNIHSKSYNENIDQLEQSFEILRKNNLRVRASKTFLLFDKILFCGHIITNGTRRPNPEKVTAIKKLKSPACKKEAQSLFGLLNYHRSYIQDFAKKSAEITKSYSKGFQWTEEAEKSLISLKDEICKNALRLQIPDPKNANFVVESDACDKGMAAVLYVCENKYDHKHDAKCLRAVEYYSKGFDDQQAKYYIREKEILAFKSALQKWRCYLLGRKFVRRTDHADLKWANRVKTTKVKLAA